MLITVKRTSLEDLCQSENSAKLALPHPHPKSYVDPSGVSTSTTSTSPLLPTCSRPSLKPIPIANDCGIEGSPSIAHYEHLDQDFRDYFVGPVPKDFFRELLPKATTPVPRLRPSLVGALAQFNPMSEEWSLCRPLVSFLTSSSTSVDALHSSNRLLRTLAKDFIRL